MGRYARLSGVVLAVLAVGLLLGGCAKKQPGVTTATGNSGEQLGTATHNPSRGAMVIRDLQSRQGRITSYVQVLSGDSAQRQAIKVKLQNGRPVRMRMDSWQTGRWTLIQLDKQTMYMCDPGTNTATAQSMAGDSGIVQMMGAPMEARLPDPNSKELPTLSSDPIEGVDCWRFDSGDFGRVWYDKQTGLTKQVESGQMVSTFRYEQINSVPDSEFELPSSMQVKTGQ